VPDQAEVCGPNHRFQSRLKVYPNRASSMVLTSVDQLWIADITYIRLEEEFVYRSL
jgi:hypothetical protein